MRGIVAAAALATLIAGLPGLRAPGEAVSQRGARSTERAAAPAICFKTTYRNPVLDDDFPDPTVLRASDGWYYAYATQTLGSHRRTNISVARSRDLVRWDLLPDAMPTKPKWASTTQNFWAPHVLEDSGTYYLYYSVEPDTRDGMCLAVATAKSPAGPFVDSGAPMKQGKGIAAIDSMPFDDPKTGKRLLYWGSGGEPIYVQELAPDRLRFAPGSEPIPLLKVSAAPYERLIEGAFVILRDGYYYLFYSGDNCCNLPANYAVMVARSRSATGPFRKLGEATGRASSVILEEDDRWKDPGHNSIFTDAAGVDWMIYHAIDPRQPFIPGTRATRRAMLIDRVGYRNGWPFVERGVPSWEPRAAPHVTP